MNRHVDRHADGHTETVSTTPWRQRFLAAEFVLVWFGVPALLAWGPWRVLPIPVLWLASAIGLTALLLDRTFDRRTLVDVAAVRTGALGAIARAGLVAAAIAGLTLLIAPDRFLEFPRERPEIWAVVVLLYPLLSVVPQTVLYRSLLAHRYRGLFGEGLAMTVAGGMAFGFAHVLFRNGIAPALTLVGGLVLMRTYLGHRSAPLSAFEHALYGLAVFTFGLGRWFYGGAIS